MRKNHVIYFYSLRYLFLTAMNEKKLFGRKRTSIPLLFLILLSAFCPISVDATDFEFVEEQMKYDDAQSYCRRKNSDLVTIHNLAEMKELISKYSTRYPYTWIGLQLGNNWTWHWSQPDQSTNFFNWVPGESPTEGQDACAAMDENGRWFEDDCGTELSFVCHDDGKASSYTFVNESKTWSDAQSYCRNISSQLVSIQSVEENAAVLNITASQIVWIGLFRDAWKWSDGSNSSFRFWGTKQPQSVDSKKCVAANFQQEGMWENRNCQNPNSFICYAQQSTPTTTSSQTTRASLTTTDQLSTNMTTILQNSSQGFTTFQPTVATTEQLNTTSVTTTANTNTTNFVSHPSSTELSDATTESTVTPTQQHQKPTVNVTTSIASTLTMGTSAQSTTLTSTVSQSSQAGNLILIQKNMMWVEALSYCREHYFDLVHITNQVIQDKVAEKAKSATSSYVWLGLRYSCNFKFWFWAGSTSGCYQNWFPGQGPDRMYECGVSGAMDTTGGQQWTGLPETEKLNFLCNTCAG